MASASDRDCTCAPTQDNPNDAAVDEQSQHADSLRVRVEDDKPKNDQKKKKKPAKRSAGAKKRGTGFEEYFCDPPLTAAEFNEEKNIIYPPHRPFVDRIEECIQRYRARRRLGPERDNLFSRYLLLGGIDVKTRQFQSTRNITDDTLEEASRADIREMTADDVIQRGADSRHNSRFYNPNYPEHWDVDFTGVASGFVSEHLPKMVGSNLDDFFIGVEVVLNFLKYVDRHDVCPEYAADVRRAQEVCLQALDETPAMAELLRLVPGPFNTALRVLHCKEDENASGVDCFVDSATPDPQAARVVKAATLSIHFGPNRFPISATEWVVTDMAEYAFEVREISLPDDATRAKYNALNQHLSGQAEEIRPCGTMLARPIIIRDCWDNTMRATIPPEVDVDHEFLLEENALQLLTEGIKLTMGVCTLNVGLKFIKHVKDIRPSFYVFLPQELMFNYKEPVPNERPSRSIHDGPDDEDGDGEE